MQYSVLLFYLYNNLVLQEKQSVMGMVDMVVEKSTALTVVAQKLI